MSSITSVIGPFGSGPGPGGGGGEGADPYPLYTSFDRNTVPWHTAAGSWGPQFQLVAPTQPTTSRTQTVNTTSEFDTQAAIAGTQITIGTSFAWNTRIEIGANDIDVIVPPGITTGAIQIGRYGDNGAVRRVRIRGSTDGTRGGQIGQLRNPEWPEARDIYSDLTVDGVDTNAAGGTYGAGERNQMFRLGCTRAFFHRVRGISAGYGSQSGISNVVYAKCNFLTGAVPRSALTYPEGWGFRDTSGPIYFIDSMIRTTRYHVLRPYSYDLPGENLLVRNCDLINVAEGQGVWMYNLLSEPAFGYGFAGIVEDSRIYQAQTAGCDFGPGGQVVDMFTCTYSRVRRNTIYSGGTGNNVTSSQSWLDNARTAAIAHQNGDTTLVSRGRAPLPADAHVVNDSNTFATLTGLPSWPSDPGDPTGITLPEGLTLDLSPSAICPTVY